MFRLAGLLLPWSKEAIAAEVAQLENDPPPKEDVAARLATVAHVRRWATGLNVITLACVAVALFFMEHEPAHGKRGSDCVQCHGGALFSDHHFHDNGLGDDKDHGRGLVTGYSSDQGKFATPSLRNIALTAPYMHDGRLATLEEVVDHYNTGVKRTPNLDPNLAKHPDAGLGLSSPDRAALVAFLKTLSDATRSDDSGAAQTEL